MKPVALVLVVLTACSSSYMPQSRGRVAMMIRDGQQAYVRDGRVYEHGFLGGGLVDAVEGNVRATRAANEYHDRMKTGIIAAVIGVAAMLGGTVVTASSLDLDDTSDRDEQRAKTGLLIMLGGMVLSCVGAGYAASAEPYRWDAINIFNDEGPTQMVPTMPGYYAPPPRTSMKMRD
jgi:hypothetical protein